METSFSVIVIFLLVGLALSDGQRYNQYRNRNRYYGHGNRGYGNYNNRYGYGHRRRCSPPSRPQYGGYDGDDDYYDIGYKITYYCYDGYELYGSPYSTCKYSSQSYRGYWDNSTPYCRPIKKKCPKLENPENGVVEQSGFHPGDKATYSCNRGYNLLGSNMRKCQRNGQWSGSAPTCEPVDCGRPEDADDNGDVSYDGTTLGSIARYTCNKGYVLVGSKIAQCLYTGQWSYGAPKCRPVDCGRPEAADENGSVRYRSTTLGSTAFYKCNRGYELDGLATAKCLFTGEWSSGAPDCIPVDCGEPDEPDENGSVEFDTTTLGSTASYSCNRGYILKGSKTVKCLFTGEWSDNAPDCIPIDCGDPEDPDPNGTLEVGPTTLGSIARYSCNKGFKLIGSKTAKCRFTGKWSSGAPKCQRIRCPKVKVPEYGSIHYSGYYPTDYVHYECDYGYYLEGSSRRDCTYSGTWTDSDPKCIKDYHPYGGYPHGGYPHGGYPHGGYPHGDHPHGDQDDYYDDKRY